jgi:hypothetical protein
VSILSAPGPAGIANGVLGRPAVRAPGVGPRRHLRLAALVDARDAVCICVLIAFCAVLLRRSLLHGEAMLGFDLFNYFFPSKVFTWELLRRGELPLWNPYVFFGVPFLANIQMGVLYPPNVLFGLWEFHRAVSIGQWAHLSVGAAGMYFLCRRGWELAPMASLFGGLAFAGSGFFAAHMGHLNQVHASIWLPWIALSQMRLARTISGGLPDAQNRTYQWIRRLLPAVPWTIGGGAAVALQLTAGHTQEAYYSLLSLGLLAAGFSLFPPLLAPARASHLVAYALTVGNGALVAAAQLLPTFELSRFSYRRGGVPLEEAVAFGVERTHILETILPTFWSLPGQEVTGYVGVITLILAVPGLALSGSRRVVLALSGLALFSLTLSMGTYTPLYALLHQWLPQFDSFRAPGRWLLIWTFAVAGLAAHGVHGLRYRQQSELRERAAHGYGVALAAVAAALLFAIWRTNEVHAIQWLPHARVAVLWILAAMGAAALGMVALFSRVHWPQLALSIVLALELGYAAREMEYNRPNAPDLYREMPVIARHLRSLTGLEGAQATALPDRVVSLAVDERLDRERLSRTVMNGDGDAEYRRYAAMLEAIRPNLGVTMGLPTVDGYDGGLLPLRDYARFKSLLITAETPVPHYTLGPQAFGRADASLLGVLNVRFLLTDGRFGAPGPGWVLHGEAPGAAWLYENTRVLPRAFLAGDTVVEPDPDRAIGLMRSLDLGRTAVINRPLPRALSPPSGTVRIDRASAGEVVAQVETTGEALLVLTDTFYPGWRASVDGRPVSIVQANVLFRGVVVPAGSHEVRFWFDPLSVKLGLAMSGLALVVNAFGVWWSLGHRPQERPRRVEG